MDDITHSEAGTVKISECETATRCLICGKEIITPNFYRYPIVCDDCKQAVELIKVLYRQNEGLWDCNQGGSRDIVKEILQKIKELAVERYDYFGKLRAKNLEHNGYIQDSDVSNENALFDLGEMDAFNCIIDRVKELAKEHGVELEE